MMPSLPSPKIAHLVLFLSALFLSISLILLTMPQANPVRSMPCPSSYYLIRQGLYGLLAFMLAGCVGHFNLHGALMRYWYIFPLFFVGVLLATPLSIWMGNAHMVYGYGWWTRSTGQIAFLLALVFSLSVALPQFALKKKGGLAFMAALLALALAGPILLLKDAGVFIISFVVILCALVFVLPPRRIAYAVLVLVPVFMLALCAWLLSYPRALKNVIDLFQYGIGSHFQLLQAQAAFHAGGLIGAGAPTVWIPEWMTDFFFAHLCNRGGMLAGSFIVFLISLLSMLAWHIAQRQKELNLRVLAACCAATLTTSAFLHVAVNLGLFPTTAFHFPFFSYAPRMLLFDGLLLGLLISIHRGTPAEIPDALHVPSSDVAQLPRRIVPYFAIGLLVLVALFIVRMGFLAFTTPYSFSNRTHAPFGEQPQKSPVRGRILDAHGRVLTQTGTRLIACVDPQRLRKSHADRLQIPALATLLGIDEKNILKTLETRQRYVRLKKGISPDVAHALKQRTHGAFFVDAVPARDYPFNTPLAHLIGCTGSAEDYRALSGMEIAENSVLKAGGDVQLTLFIELQHALQACAEAAVHDLPAKRAQLIVMEAHTGAIRAAAQVPAVHGNAFFHEALHLMRWQASGEVFEPGGLLKPLIVASALDQNILSTTNRIDCEHGVWFYQGHPLHDPMPCGALTPAEILQKGSNIGMAKIALLMGPTPLYTALRMWSLDQGSAAGLKGVERGILPSTNHWSKLGITRLAMGHGCAVTLLQLLCASTALFNAGCMVEPTLIAATRPSPRAEWQPTPTSISRAVIRPETAAWMCTALKKEDTEGLSVIGQPAIVQKTLIGESGYDPTRVITAFMGSVEQAQTRYLIAVLIDEPTRDCGIPNPALHLFQQTVQCLEKVRCSFKKEF